MTTDETLTSDKNRTPPAVHLRIAGQRLNSGSGGTHEHINPSTGLADATIPLAGPDDVDGAVEAAHLAFETWKRTAPAERRRLLHRLADLIEENSVEFARLGALDNGVPLGTSASFPPLSAEWTRYYAGWADKLSSEVTGNLRDDGELGFTLAQPYGVIGIIITWNGPLISLAMKIPAALAAGNTVVVKPSELTPFSGELFMDLIEQAGFPDGVVNILPGNAAAGAALVEHPLVKKVSFTGGPATAQKILEACARQLKPTIMELGGKSANIIFEDANLDVACMLGTFMSVGVMAGQGCAFPTRMLVHESIYDEVVARVTAVAAGITTGDPLDVTNVSGPVVNADALERILGVIERAKAEGARLVAGGGRIPAERLSKEFAAGYFVEPTVFVDVDPNSDLAQNEVFGPVLAISKFATDDEAIAIANNSRYGLSGYVHTADLKRALRVAEELVTGEVLINGARNLAVHRPFGGIAVSGFGKEGGRAGIDDFLRVKAVGIA
jgi:aldehyde dehydrogenase (NAD+)